MVEAEKPIVTITGVSGFIGAQVCLDFLKAGEFRVRGTVRDKNNETKIAPLRKAFGDLFQSLELVEADLLNEDSLHRAVAGSKYVVHTASPVVFNPQHDDDVIKPAVEGTLAVMKACTASGVKRVVVTSSVAAVTQMAATDKPHFETGFYDETCWSNPDRPEGLGVYQRSKTLAEKLAWDYVRDTDNNLELVTIQPCLVQGPALIPGGFGSANHVLSYFSADRIEVPIGRVGVVDVRDVSKIHLESVRRPDAAGNRFIAYAERVLSHEAAQYLNSEFASKGFTVCTKPAQGTLDPDARCTNKKSINFFGIDYIPAKNSYIAMANSLIEHGVLKPATH